MVVVPTLTPAARPVAALMVATDRADEDHATDDVITAVEASEYVPVAINGWVAPTAIVWVAGVTAMDERVAATGALDEPPPPPPHAVNVTAVKQIKSTNFNVFFMVIPPVFFCFCSENTYLNLPPA